MISIQKTKYLRVHDKIALLSILSLLWILGGYALQASQQTVHTAEEDTIVQSIWEGQIDPALDWPTTPLFQPSTLDNPLQTSVPPWNFSTESFMPSHTFLVGNNFTNTPNIASFSPLMTMPNPFENSLYNLPEFTLTADSSSLGENQPASLEVTSRRLPSAPIEKKKKVAMVTTQSPAHKEKSHLDKDVSLATRKKSYICSYCNKNFIQLCNLKTHVRTHTKEKPYNCSYCNKKFSHKSNLIRHIRTHTNEKPYKCSYCHKRFTYHYTLKIHVRIHTKEKPFQCIYCDKSFAQKSALKSHLRTHTKERPYICTYCPKSFSQKGNLTRHIKSQHE